VVLSPERSRSTSAIWTVLIVVGAIFADNIELLITHNTRSVNSNL